MAHSKSAKKRVKQNEKARLRNKSEKTRMRTQTKKVLKLMQVGEDMEKITKEYRLAIKYYDVASKHGLIHNRQADRRKSRLTTKLNDYVTKQNEK